MAVTVTKIVAVCNCGQLHSGSGMLSGIGSEQLVTVTVVFELLKLIFHT